MGGGGERWGMWLSKEEGDLFKESRFSWGTIGGTVEEGVRGMMKKRGG